MPHRLLSLMLPAIMFSSICLTTGAQESKKLAAVAITVTDTTGAPIPHARIELIPAPDTLPKPVEVDKDGKLSISLPSGNYEMLVSYPGFRTSTQHLQINSSANQTLTVGMTIASCPPGPCITIQASQPSDSRLSGAVVDSEGAVISNALVLIHWDESGSQVGLNDNKGTKEDIRRRTNKDGRIDLDLPPGFYDIFVASTAFSPACLKVRVKAGNPATFKVKLKADPLVCKELCDTFQ